MHDQEYGRITRRDFLAGGRVSTASATSAHVSIGGNAAAPLRCGQSARRALPFTAVNRREDVATYELALRKGQEIVSTLLEFAREKRLVSGSLKAIGAVSDAQIACFDPVTKQYRKTDMGGQAGVASLIGGLGLINGKPLLHVHAVLALRDGSVRSGQLVQAHMLETFVITLTGWARPLRRTREVDTGLKGLCLAS